jgi:cobalt/nickel transport system permease protein
VHLADGILTDPALVTGLNLVGAGALGMAVREVVDDGDRHLALTGTLAAFVFVAQAINVPLAPGASAHVIGATLLTLTVGAARAVVALSAVLLAQALLLADGGVVVLGLNMLHIAVLPVLTVALVRRLMPSGPNSLRWTAIVGTTLGNAAGAASLAGALVVGAGAEPMTALGWLLGVQTAAGLLEGLLTAAVVTRVQAIAPQLLSAPTQPRRPSAAPGAGRVLAWATVAVGIALALSPLTSTTPDALDKVVRGLVTPP